MIDSLRWWLSTRRNATLAEWMKEQYTREELRRLIDEATDVDLVRPWNPMAQGTYVGGESGEQLLRRTVKRLYTRYGDEIWRACYRAAARGRPTDGYDLYSSWLEAFSTLSGAYQVIMPKMFEEMLVRHALRQCAIDILQDEQHAPRGGTA